VTPDDTHGVEIDNKYSEVEEELYDDEDLID